MVVDDCIDDDAQDHVHDDTGYHDDEFLPARFGTQFIWLGFALHLLLVHALVYHADDLHIAAQRQPADAVFGIASLEGKELFAPGIKEYEELLHPDPEHAGGQKVAEFVNEHQDGEG